jgi:hypothetical protein
VPSTDRRRSTTPPVAATSRAPPSTNSRPSRRPLLEPPPAWTPPPGTRETCAEPPVELLELEVELVVGLGVAVELTAVMFVRRVVRHVTVLPPGLPVPLHWLTVMGIARLICDAVPTEQATVAPPPFAEPLHWVTVALVVDAGNGLQFTVPPPPAPEPTHSLTVAAVTGRARDVLALMLFVMVTSQVIGCAASLSEPLHCWTVVTRLVEWVVKVPFGEEQAPRVHVRETVVVELVVLPRIVLTTVTAHVRPVVAPSAAGPCPLHWSIVRVAACAVDGDSAAIANENAAAMRSAISAV